MYFYLYQPKTIHILGQMSYYTRNMGLRKTRLRLLTL